MAAKSAKSRTAARKLRDKWKSKRWYSIRAPRNPHSFKVIGETLSENPENVVGRIHEVTQNEMDGDFTKMHIKLKFRVTEVLNQDANDDGKINGPELYKGLIEHIGDRLSPGQVSMIINALDTNDDNRIDLVELSAALDEEE